MRNILINFLTSNTGGVINFKKSILKEFNNILEGTNDLYYVLLDNNEIAHNKELKNLHFISGYDAPKNLFQKVKFYEIIVGRITKKYHIDLIFNFGDIPADVNCRQIMYFDWPYAVYNDRNLWNRMSVREFLSKHMKKKYFWRTISRCDSIVAQTQTIKKRLLAKNAHLAIDVVDVGYDECEAQTSNTIVPPNQIKNLIYPTLAYPHKNVEILFQVALKLRKLSREYKFMLTFDGSEGPREKQFKAKVGEHGLDSYFKFFGRIDRDSLVKAIEDSDGIIMPTLVETYGLPYIESQVLNKIMFTSNRDFSRELCADAAIYFDPLDPDDIVRAITSATDDPKLVARVCHQIEQVKKMRISWRESVQHMKVIIDRQKNFR